MNKIVKVIYIYVLLLLFAPIVNAQQQDTVLDVIENNVENNSTADSLAVRTIDSLVQQIVYLKEEKSIQEKYIDSLKLFVDSIAKEGSEINFRLEVIDSLNGEISYYSGICKKQTGRILYLERLCDSLITTNESYQQKLKEKNKLLEEKITALQEKELLFTEKEKLYQDAIMNSNVDRVKLEGLLDVKNINIEAKNKEIEYLQKSIVEKETSLDRQMADYQKVTIEREHYRLLVDTLRIKLNDAERTILKTNEALKYTERRAAEAEAQIKQATNKKKKVRVIQGLAMRLYRTPEWSTRPVQTYGTDGNLQTVYKITNKNAGSVEFDFITGASVMLWDLTSYFNTPVIDTSGNITRLKKFDQEFSYDLGLYIGFGGSNLFKNFYIGPSFKFLDFFHVAIGANIAEYEALTDDYKEGDVLPAGFSIDDQTTDVWKVTMFLSISLDLDFLSYIKK